MLRNGLEIREVRASGGNVTSCTAVKDKVTFPDIMSGRVVREGSDSGMELPIKRRIASTIIGRCYVALEPSQVTQRI
jgi:hypothetical protein